MLLFRAGAALCALPLTSVGETMRPLPIEPLPGTLEVVLGLAIVRGAPTPVVDLAMLLGARPGAETPQRFVTLRLGERVAMLAVTSVVGVRVLNEGAMHGMPALVGAIAADVVRQVAVLDHALLAVLEAGALVPEGAWHSIEGRM